MPRIDVDYSLCEANGACQKSAPRVFTVDDSDRMHLLVASPPAEEMERVRAAVRRCPRGALSLRDDTRDSKHEPPPARAKPALG